MVGRLFWPQQMVWAQSQTQTHSKRTWRHSKSCCKNDGSQQHDWHPNWCHDLISEMNIRHSNPHLISANTHTLHPTMHTLYHLMHTTYPAMHTHVHCDMHELYPAMQTHAHCDMHGLYHGMRTWCTVKYAHPFFYLVQCRHKERISWHLLHIQECH